jgi:hypothetical protein
MTDFPRVRRVLREPLLHFLLLGFALFLVHGWIGGPAGGEGGRIVITQGRIEQLTVGFLRMNQRLPDKAELDNLVDDAIREEVYYREAKAMGLDQDDTIVRRRLRQKLEFVSEDVASIPEPTDVQLRAYLHQHAARFREEPRYSLTQLYLDPQRHGARIASDAHHLLLELQHAGPATLDTGKQGDPFLLDRRFDHMAASDLSRLFGMGFEAALRTAPIGKWIGPVPSGYGTHLVLVRERQPERRAALADVRDAVRGEWMAAQRAAANARFYADRRRHYVVTIEYPKAPAGSGLVAGLR